MTAQAASWWQRRFDGPLASVLGVAGGYFLTHSGTSDAALDADLDRIAAFGCRWVRADFAWSQVQAGGSGSYDWSLCDRLATKARDRNLAVIGVIAYTPSWARVPPGSDDKHLPVSAAAFGAFAGECAKRYGARSSTASTRGTVRVWEIWNEPNHGPFAKPTPDPVKHFDMLRESYTAIKREDPGAYVVTGGTAPAPQTPPSSYSPVGWYFALHTIGRWTDHVDGVGHHPYAYPFHHTQESSWNAMQQTRSINALVRAQGARKPIWATEIGWRTENTPTGVTEEEQAVRLREYTTWWFRSLRALAGPLIVFQHRDIDTGNYGLLRADGSAKPARQVFVDLCARGITP